MTSRELPNPAVLESRPPRPRFTDGYTKEFLVLRVLPVENCAFVAFYI